MSQPADMLFEEAQALPEEERALLALQLLDSIGQPETEIERAWREEVRQRLADIDAGRTTLATRDEARRRIFTRCSAAEHAEFGSDEPLAWGGDGWEAHTEGRL
jgi:putative addiction module component (TIGR02574 family)